MTPAASLSCQHAVGTQKGEICVSVLNGKWRRAERDLGLKLSAFIFLFLWSPSQCHTFCPLDTQSRLGTLEGDENQCAPVCEVVL